MEKKNYPSSELERDREKKPSTFSRAKSLLSEIKKERRLLSEDFPSLTFRFPLNSERRAASACVEERRQPTVEDIRCFLSSDDFVVRKTGIYLLGIYRRDKIDILPLLRKFSDDNSWTVRAEVAQTLSKIESGGEILEKLKRDSHIFVYEEAYCSMVTRAAYLDRSLSKLVELASHESEKVRQKVAESLVAFGERAMFLHIELKNDSRWKVREAVAYSLGYLGGERSFGLLSEMVRDESYSVREAVIRSLRTFGEKALPFIRLMRKDKHSFVRETAGKATADIMTGSEFLGEESRNFHEWLLTNRKSLFATPYTKELTSLLETLTKIVKRLKTELGKEFIGMIIVGSIEKGYSRPYSDLDAVIISENPKAMDRFKKLTEREKIKLCPLFRFPLKKSEVGSYVDLLFCGIFLGDRYSLSELQNQTLNNISELDWNFIREKILNKETTLPKLSRGYRVDEDEIKKIEILSTLVKVPPPLKETQAVFQK